MRGTGLGVTGIQWPGVHRHVRGFHLYHALRDQLCIDVRTSPLYLFSASICTTRGGKGARMGRWVGGTEGGMAGGMAGGMDQAMEEGLTALRLYEAFICITTGVWTHGLPLGVS